MTNLAQSDLFINFVGVAQIFLFVFSVFVLGLLVKILSDISQISGRVKRESAELLTDMADIRTEAKEVVKAVISYTATFISAAGVRKFAGLMAGILEQTKKRPARKKATGSSASKKK